MKNLKFIILSFVFLLPLLSYGYAELPYKPEEVKLPFNVIDVVPLKGVNDCPECVKSFKAGANKDDIKMIKWHDNQIFGGGDGKSSSGSVDGKSK